MKNFWVCVCLLVSGGCLDSAIESPNGMTNNGTNHATNSATNSATNNVTNNATNNATNNDTDNPTNNATNNATNNTTNNDTNNGRCARDSDCNDVDSSACTAGQCVACVEDMECTHLSDTPYCQGGVCGACSTESEKEVCSERVCDPTSLTCSEYGVGAQATCGECISSTQCAVGSRCIQTTNNAFCLLIAPVSGPCPIPFVADTFQDVESASVEVCGSDNIDSGCAQYLKLGATCSTGADCGAIFCAMSTTSDDYCTYGCNEGALCPSGYECKDSACRH